jgi:tetratricopeptide (TPR) repeat protein
MKIIDKLWDKTQTFFLKIEKEDVYKLWDKTQTFSVNFLKVFLAFIFLTLVIHTSWEISSHDLVIKPFETPFNLARESGYTGVVVARKLQDKMEEIREEIQRSLAAGGGAEQEMQGVMAAQFSELQKQQKIDIPTVGLSLNAIVYQFRKMFGMKQRSITGDIVKKDENFYLTLRITDKPVVNLGPDMDIDELIKKAARKVLMRLEPLTFGLGYYTNNEPEKLEPLIKELRQVGRFQKTKLPQKEEAIVLTLEGCLLAIQKKPKLAIEKFVKAEKLSSAIKKTILRIKGNAFKSLKEYDKAIDSYKEALTLDSEPNGDIYVQWAIALTKAGKVEEAKFKFETAAEKDFDNPWVYTAWGRWLLADKLKKYTEAYEKFVKAKEINPNYALNYALWADALLRDKKYLEATVKFKQAINLDLSVAWVHDNYGLTLMRLARYQDAAKQYKLAVELKPSKELYHRNLGYALLKSGRYQEAVEQYKQAIELAPNVALVLRGNYGVALVELKRYKQAVMQFRKAIKLDNNAAAWIYPMLGYALLELQKPQEALIQCKTALKLKVNNRVKTVAHAICGLAQLKLNQPQKALEDCETAQRLNESLKEKKDWAYWCLGDIYMSRNEPKVAVKQYEAAVND